MDIHAPLPECASLDLDQARHTALYLRSAMRPHILQRLRELQGKSDLGSFIDRQELEMRLAELHHYGKQVDQHIAGLEPLPPAEAAPLKLFDIVRDDHGIRARAPCFYTPESEYFVHGPVAIAHILALAEHWLGAEDPLIEIEKVDFKAQMQHELELHVFEAGTEWVDPAQTPCFKGSLLCASGRRLQFQAVPLAERNVNEMFGSNSLAFALLPSEYQWDEQGENHVFALNPNAMDTLEEPVSLPLFAYTLLDLGMIAAVRTEGQDGRTQLCTQVRNLPLLRNCGELFRQGLRYEVKILRERAREAEGVRFVPMRYRLAPIQAGFSRGMFAEIEGGMSERFAR